MAFVHGRTYYVHPEGDDKNDGEAIETAWQSIDRVNQETLRAGDSVLFHGGDFFYGTIELGEEESGTADSPIVIGSYGEGRAIIRSGDEKGFFAHNCGGIWLRDLVFEGPGSEETLRTGVRFLNSLPDETQLHFIRIEGILVHGYGTSGIEFYAEKTLAGYADVGIAHTEIYDIGHVGIQTVGKVKLDGNTIARWAFKDIRVSYCKIYQVLGAAHFPNQHTGDGIWIRAAQNVQIDHCEVYNCGRRNIYEDAGPVGVGCANSDNIVIEYNEAHHISTSSIDGCGFDFDGGVTRAIMQYNYSHHNDGAGFLIAQFPSSPRMDSLIVRYNISQNDARQNNYGAIHLWAHTAVTGGINRVFIYHNTVFLNRPSNGSWPVALQFRTPYIYQAKVCNNIFMTDDGLTLVDNRHADVQMLGNCYWHFQKGFRVKWKGAEFRRFRDWQNSGFNQERWNGAYIGMESNPWLEAPGTCTTIGDPDALNQSFFAYMPQGESPAIDEAFDLGLLGIPLPDKDFTGRRFYQTDQYDIGAIEYIAESPDVYQSCATGWVYKRIDNSRLEVEYMGHEDGEVKVRLFDHAGYLHKAFDTNIHRGLASLQINLDDLAIGTYFVVIETKREREVKRFIVW